MDAEFDIDAIADESNLDDFEAVVPAWVDEDGEEVVEGELVAISTQELTEEEATELTENIRSTGEVLYVLVSRAHAGKAHLALGYSSFEAYVKEEFGMSRSRAYQLIGQANVIKEITEAVPEGTDIAISEAAARDLKGVLDKVVPSLAERTENMSPEEAAGVVQDTVDEFRESEEDDVFDSLSDDDIEALLGEDLFGLGETGGSFDEEIMGDLRDREGFSSTNGGGSGGSGSGGGGGFGEGMDDFPDFDDDLELPSIDDDDLSDMGNDSTTQSYDTIYEFYGAITTISTLPDPKTLVSEIPEARLKQITESSSKSLEWLTEFSELWKERVAEEGITDEE